MAEVLVNDLLDSPLEQFRRLIMSRRLQPGDRVPSIRDLARRYKCCVIAVREETAENGNLTRAVASVTHID